LRNLPTIKSWPTRADTSSEGVHSGQPVHGLADLEAGANLAPPFQACVQ
jgi:hypothetical protein